MLSLPMLCSLLIEGLYLLLVVLDLFDDLHVFYAVDDIFFLY